MNKEKEIWKKINNADKYMISNWGRVQLLNEITCGSEQNGYMGVTIYSNNNIKKNYSIHRLVAEHFVNNNKDLLLTVDHIDKNKKNNYYKNLQWLSCKENVQKSLAKPILQFSLDGELLNKYVSLSEAEDAIGAHKANIHKAMYNIDNCTHASNFIWISEKQYLQDNDIINEKINLYKNRYSNNSKSKIIDYSVYKIDINTNIIIEKIDSIVNEISNITKRSNIKRVCNGTRKSAYGYKWKFAD